MHRGVAALFAFLLPACHEEVVRDPGPPPGAGHQDVARAKLQQVLGAMHELDGALECRFAEPVADRVAQWHWEPQDDGRPHAFGYRHGWRVDVWVTPRYVGYPEQPTAHKMAFFADGQLRGLFGEGRHDAPLELDAWYPLWVDPAWRPQPSTPIK